MLNWNRNSSLIFIYRYSVYFDFSMQPEQDLIVEDCYKDEKNRQGTS
jgi:hypothetical protein